MKLYYNSWCTETTDWPGFRRSKHIYLGSERIVTRLNMEGVGTSYGDVNTYYYHPDHLGSVHSVTDVNGDAYERLEYTPFGEMWVEIREDNDTAHLNYIPFRFTAKEWDPETNLYYYGARYMDPRTSRWMSGDPAGFELINPMDGEGKARSGYSVVEATGWYSYVSNNPVRYVDPTGMDSENPIILFANPTADNPSQKGKQGRISYPMAGLPDIGPCTYRSLLGISETRSGNNLSPSQIRQGVKDLRKSGTLDGWMVDSQEDVINYGLSILGSDEKAEWISRSLNLDKNGTIPEGAEASLVKTDENIFGYVHFGEGDSQGNDIWDSYGEDTITTVNRVDFFQFTKKEESE